MKLDSLEMELYDFTGRELHELAWNKRLPIDTNLALWCFLQAFRDYKGIDVRVDANNKKADFELLAEVDGKFFPLGTQMSYDEILRGWGHAPRSSLAELYNAMYAVYDKMQDSLVRGIRENPKGALSRERLEFDAKYRKVAPRQIRKIMEQHLLDYFLKYHENVFVPLRETNGILEPPKIFFDVLKEFPLELLRNAITTPSSGGPCAEHILDYDFADFDVGVYYPSESSLMDLFRGMYLKRLAEKKEYPISGKDKSLERFVVRGRDNFAVLNAA